ncbi:Histone-lysine N-methyltransferase ASHH2 [Acorus calamus]|uniref:Histone-lysine N-methyltransferase ASHH2 n=1 Tax=Acorus calamus TaxID=4465 RepID=A0AAV9DMI7_ACOCL|nr:Histone-lysine N-methyltransferase ASHH2 [Acorus calamus]
MWCCTPCEVEQLMTFSMPTQGTDAVGDDKPCEPSSGVDCLESCVSPSCGAEQLMVSSQPTRETDMVGDDRPCEPSFGVVCPKSGAALHCETEQLIISSIPTEGTDVAGDDISCEPSSGVDCLESCVFPSCGAEQLMVSSQSTWETDVVGDDRPCEPSFGVACPESGAALHCEMEQLIISSIPTQGTDVAGDDIPCEPSSGVDCPESGTPLPCELEQLMGSSMPTQGTDVAGDDRPLEPSSGMSYLESGAALPCEVEQLMVSSMPTQGTDVLGDDRPHEPSLGVDRLCSGDASNHEPEQLMASSQSTGRACVVGDDKPSEPPSQMACLESGGVAGASAFSIGATDKFGQGRSEGKDDAKLNFTLVYKRGSLRRSSRSVSSSHVVAKLELLPSTTNTLWQFRQMGGFSSKEVRKKRSFNHRRLRDSAWGALEHLTGISSPDPRVVKVQKKGSKKAKCRLGEKGRQKARKDGSSRGSRAKCMFLSSRPRVQVDMVNFAAGTPKSLSDGLPKPDSLVDLGVGVVVDGCEHNIVTQMAHVTSINNKNPVMPFDASFRNGSHGNKEMESTVTQDVSVENTSGECPMVPGLVGPIYDRNLDQGTSPDVDVLHLIPQSGSITSESVDTSTLRETFSADGLKNQNDLNPESKVEADLLNIASGSFGASDELLPAKHAKQKKGKKKGKIRGTPRVPSEHKCVEKALLNPPDSKKTRRVNRSQPSRKVQNSFHSRKDSHSEISGNIGEMTTSIGELLDEPGMHRETFQKNEIEAHALNLGKGGNSSFSGVMGNNSALSSPEGASTCSQASSEGMLSSVMVPGSEDDLTPKKSLAWASCDDCGKWRRIPNVLVDVIGQNDSKWTCKDNTDKDYADCSVPQEMSDEDINLELGIPNTSCEDNSCIVQLNSKASDQAPWIRIKQNIFLHRKRKSQPIDEIMVCQCRPPSDGNWGCGENCLNRVLNIECVRGTCPCGDLCSNQQFQKRKYAKFKWFRCGKKGYGLQLQEDVSKGDFLIEYVGEVLDLPEYEARQRHYASRGQKHFYFMTLNGSEVIDACAKGNLGRFINHSCDPNCCTEKWMVNGEVCVGLFAIRDLKKGEEVTFDYNYVRVFGAVAKKCVCGSAGCRGYIGGDPLKTEAVDQDHSDDDYPEPVMVNEIGEKEINENQMILDTSSNEIHDNQLIPDTNSNEINENQIIPDTSSNEINENQIIPDTSSHDTLMAEHAIVSRNAIDETSGSSSVMEMEISSPIEDTEPKSLPLELPLEISSEVVNSSGNTVTGSVGDKSLIVSDAHKASKSRPRVKSSVSHGTLRKGKRSTISLVGDKSNVVAAVSGNRCSDGVEQKLNEFLDLDGGISKRKEDASKGYLKLLLLTAACGDNVKGEAIQSTRDLSIILDALLKTKSRMILVDVINKNGLQMLHNIMKQNRKNFNRTPVIRKLLKVFEFLASSGILTLEHIARSPPYSEMESLEETIISLRRHNDLQVQQMARSFLEKWVPLESKRISPCNRGGRWLGSRNMNDRQFLSYKHHRHPPPRDYVSNHRADQMIHSSPPLRGMGASENSIPTRQGSILIPVNSNSRSEVKPRKRKTRWDQPGEAMPDSTETISKFMKPSPVDEEPDSHWPEDSNQMCETSSEQNQLNNGQIISVSSEDIDDEAPPGFSTPLVHLRQVALEPVEEECLGLPQERYNPHKMVSYGMPMALVQQVGIPCKEEDGKSKGGFQPHRTRWDIAPAMPFYPFPPLPPLPRENRDAPVSPGSLANDGLRSEQVSNNNHKQNPRSCSSDNSLSETGVHNHCNPKRHMGWSSSDGLDRRFFRQQKWTNHHDNGKVRRPWVRHRNGFHKNSPNADAEVSQLGHGCLLEPNHQQKLRHDNEREI